MIEKSSFIGIEFQDETLAWETRKQYEKEFPGKTFGHRKSLPVDFGKLFEKRPADVFIIARADLDWFEAYTLRSGVSEGVRIVRPVYLAHELSSEGKVTIRESCQYAVVEMCEVCQKPMLSGHHKHYMKFCPTCNKRTEWVTPFFGFPFHCTSKHS